jgi:CheY-like chemotaxis protein
MSMRILLVEDDRYFSGILSDYLSHVGFEVLAAMDGRAGLDLFEEQHVDLVLTDVLMPRLSGLELAARLKEVGGGKGPPVLLMSAVYQDDADIQSNLRQCGADGYLIKPFTMEELYRKLGEHLPLARSSPLGEGRGGAGDTLVLVPGWEGSAEIPTQGEVSPCFLGEFMLQLLSASHTGVLKMVDGSRWKDIVFLNGYPMWCDGGGTHNRMGTMLLEEGTIDADQFKTAVQFMRDQGVDFGSALTDTGILSSTQLYRQLRRLNERRVISAHAWAVGQWTLTSTFPKQASCFEVQPLLAVWRGIRRHGDAQALVQFIAEYDAMYVIPTNSYQAAWNVLRFEAAFEALGSFVNGMRRVEDLRRLEVLSVEDLSCSLWLMFKAGMVGFAERPAQSGRLSSSADGDGSTTAVVQSIDPVFSGLAEQIIDDYLHLWQLDFFALFKLRPDAIADEVAEALAVQPISWRYEDLDSDLPDDIRARARALLGRIEVGRTTLESAEKRAGYRSRFEEGLTGVYRTVSAPDRTEAAVFFEEGKGYVRLYDYVAAEKAFASAVAADPETPEYQAYCAWASYRRAGGSSDAVAEARAMLLRALESDIHQPMAHYFMGLIHRDQKEFPAALEAFKQVIRIDPGFEPAQKALQQVAELASF